MKLSKKTSPDYFPDDDFSSQEIADQELKELAEKLERELGHQYFSKPLDYSGPKENKATELLELEKEIANLGEIVLPSVNLNPAKELSAPKKKSVGKKRLAVEKYQDFKLYLPTKKKIAKKSKVIASQTQEYQDFKLYKNSLKKISTPTKNHQSFQLSHDENLKNWQKTLQQNSKIHSTKPTTKKTVVKENFWEIIKKERQAEKNRREELKKNKLIEKQRLAAEKEKQIAEWQQQKQAKKILQEQEKEKQKIAEQKIKAEQDLLKKQQAEAKTLAKLDALAQKELIKKQEDKIKEEQKIFKKQQSENKILAKLEAKKQKELLKEQKRIAEEERFAEWQEQKKAKKIAKLAKKEKLAQEKEKNNLSFAWYLSIIKKSILYLVMIELLAYFFSTVPLIKDFILNNLLDYLLIIDLFVFIWLTFTIKRHLGATSLVAIKAVIMTGLLVGFFRALFKIFWFSESWTLINIIVEPLIWGFYGLVTATIFSLIIKKNDRKDNESRSYETKNPVY